MSKKPKRSEPEKPETEKASKPSEDYSAIPQGVRDFLGDEMHLFKRDKQAVILPQAEPRKKSQSAQVLRDIRLRWGDYLGTRGRITRQSSPCSSIERWVLVTRAPQWKTGFDDWRRN